MKKLFYFLLICIVIIGGVYLYFHISFLGKAKPIESLDAQFNIKTTKLADIPSNYPQRPSCESIGGINPTCYITTFSPYSIIFSPKGNTVAYRIGKVSDSTSQVIINNKKSQFVSSSSSGYELSRNQGNIVFSPDGSKISYITIENGKKTLVINEKAIDSHESISLPEFSSDGLHMGYVIKDGNDQYAIIDGKKYGPYTYITPAKFSQVYFSFSKDNNHVLFLAQKDNKNFVVLDGIEQEKHQYVFNPVLLNDGTLAYYGGNTLPANNGIDMNIIVGNTKKKDTYFDLVHPNPLFVINNQVGYITTQIFQTGKRLDAKDVVVVGEKTWTHTLSHDLLNRSNYQTFISPDNLHLAVIGNDPAQQTNNLYVLVDDRIAGPSDKKYNEVHDITFSPDGKKMAYTGWQYNSKYIVSLVTVDFETGKYTDTNIDSQIRTFSNPVEYTLDGSQIVQVFNHLNKQFVMIGDKKGPDFDQVWSPVFSPDGQYMGYGARKGHELWWIVEKI